MWMNVGTLGKRMCHPPVWQILFCGPPTLHLDDLCEYDPSTLSHCGIACHIHIGEHCHRSWVNNIESLKKYIYLDILSKQNWRKIDNYQCIIYLDRGLKLEQITKGMKWFSEELKEIWQVEHPVTDHEWSKDPPQIMIKGQCKQGLNPTLKALTKFDFNQIGGCCGRRWWLGTKLVQVKSLMNMWPVVLNNWSCDQL